MKIRKMIQVQKILRYFQICISADKASSSAEKYSMTPDFSAGTDTYTVYVPDNEPTLCPYGQRRQMQQRL